MSGTFPGAPGAEPPRGASPAPTDDPRGVQALLDQIRGCERCPQLVATRTGVVPGAGAVDARVLLVAEAPGVREDELGVPLAGGPARVLLEMIEAVGVSRDDVFVTTLLKCHPPGNRDPAPGELARCRSWLDVQVAAMRPHVVCPLGSQPARALAQTSSEGNGEAVVDGIVTIGGRPVHLLPLEHPIAATYAASLRLTLEREIAKLPELLARPLPEPPTEVSGAAEPADEQGPDDGQLGLF